MKTCLLFIALVLSVSAGAREPLSEIVHRVTVAPGETVVVTEWEHDDDDAQTVVLLPGLIGNSFSYRGIAPRLADSGARVLIIEPLCTGASGKPKNADYTLEAQARRVAGVLDSLDVAAAYFVCHSTSGSICLRTALFDEERVLGVVAINAGPDERGASPGLRSAMRYAPLLKLFGGRGIIRGKIRDGLRSSSADASWVTDDVVAGYTAPFEDLSSALNSMRAIANAVEPDSLRPRLPEVDAPVLLLVGAGTTSGVTTAAEIATLAAGLQRFDVDSIAGAGQYIHEEQPGAVLQRIRAFMQRHPADGR
jgi:pimeloyl-ACP methyl ester carboxylesterase